MRKILQISIALLFSIVLFAYANASTDHSSKQTKTSWLVVMHADHAIVQQKEGQSYLKLISPDNNIVAFSDSPNRKFTKIKIDRFIKNWDKIFSENPNAAAVHADLTLAGQQNLTAYIVTLSDPVLAKNSLTFKANDINYTFKEGKVYNDINLFIDNFTDPCKTIPAICE
ncbi:MAG: hypothetical protein AAGA27_00875 [Pseudomonadota bacterium]